MAKTTRIDGYLRVAAARKCGNRQAAAWCRDVANKKQKRALGMSPEAAMIIEWPHLQPLPRFAPPIYLPHTRIVGDHGYIHLETNRYSVPD